jgi:uncharacterized protein (DUF2235 family)
MRGRAWNSGDDMSRKILIFADGTGNEGGLLPDESRTNVYKLYRATRTGPDSPIDPSEQIAFYVSGIGTPPPGKQTPMWRRLQDGIEQGIGQGLKQKISECYAAIVSVWKPSDRIYLFGFSRGAYTVRCLAHMLEVCGIPTRHSPTEELRLDPNSLRKISRSAAGVLYFMGLARGPSEQRAARARAFIDRHACQTGADIGAVPYFVGVWETVAAIGLARLFPKRYDLHFSKDILFARHAMAIDEYRADFIRVPWGGSGTVPNEEVDAIDRFKQVWFAGDHSDVGGSYPENESRLSDIALKWMTDFVTSELPAEGRLAVNSTMLKCYPSAEGMMHDECMAGIGGTIVPWRQKIREVPSNAELHPSVTERLALPRVRNFVTIAPYRPQSLKGHPSVKHFYESETECPS